MKHSLLIIASLLLINPLVAQVPNPTTVPVQGFSAPARTQPTAPQERLVQPSTMPNQLVSRESQLVSYSVSRQKSGVTKANVLSPLVSTVSLFYEKVIGRSTSAQIGFYYTGVSLAGISYTGIGITPEFRLYLSQGQAAPSGTYMAPYIRFQSLLLGDKGGLPDRYGRLTLFGGGLLLGHQWLLGQSDTATFDVFGGPAYNLELTTVSNQPISSLFNGFGYRFGVAAGVSW